MNGKTMLIAQAEHSFAIWKKLTVNKKMLKIKAPFNPMDQPEADLNGDKHHVTRCYRIWKTFTIANVIEQTQKPSLILCHIKHKQQLYSEFKDFFQIIA